MRTPGSSVLMTFMGSDLRKGLCGINLTNPYPFVDGKSSDEPLPEQREGDHRLCRIWLPRAMLTEAFPSQGKTRLQFALAKHDGDEKHVARTPSKL
jgi:hypothetical protein